MSGWTGGYASGHEATVPDFSPRNSAPTTSLPPATALPSALSSATPYAEGSV